MVSLGSELGSQVFAIVLVIETTDPCEFLRVPVLNLLGEGCDDVVESVKSFLGGHNEFLLSCDGSLSGSLSEFSAEGGLDLHESASGFSESFSDCVCSGSGLTELGFDIVCEPGSDLSDGSVEFSNEGLNGVPEFVLFVLSGGTLVVELFLEVDDLLLEFLSLGGNGLFESSSLLLNGVELEVLSFSILSGEGVSKLGKGLLSHDSLISKSLLRVSDGGAKGFNGGVDLLLGPFGNSIDSSIELLELITEVVVELLKELSVGRVTVRRVVSSWGNVLCVCVLFFVVLLFGKVDAEDVSLVIEGAGELLGSFHEGVVEGFVVVLDLGVKGGLSIDFSLSEPVSQLLADCIEFGPLDFTEGLELVDFLVKGISESLSGLADGLRDSSSLSFEELDEVELVVGVVHEVDLLQFPGLCGIESSLLLSEGVFESGSLGTDRLNEGVVVVVKSILECGCISGETVLESGSLAIECGGEGLSGVSECSVLGSLHVGDDDFHVGECLINASFESILLNDDQFADFGLGVVVDVGELLPKVLNCVHNVFAEVVHISDEFVDGIADCAKGSCVSLLKSVVQLIGELSESGPCLSELLVEGLSESISDVVDDC